MLVGLTGPMGSGKTLFMSVMAELSMFENPQVPVYSVHNLQGALPISSVDSLINISNGIICFDEIWTSMDSRLVKDNVFLTRWVNQTRKKNILVMYTTQHFGQLDIRARRATDLLIYCQNYKKRGFFRYTFIDTFNGQMLKSVKATHKNMSKFYGCYDTYQVIKSLKKANYGFRDNKAKRY